MALLLATTACSSRDPLAGSPGWENAEVHHLSGDLGTFLVADAFVRVDGFEALERTDAFDDKMQRVRLRTSVAEVLYSSREPFQIADEQARTPRSLLQSTLDESPDIGVLEPVGTEGYPSRLEGLKSDVELFLLLSYWPVTDPAMPWQVTGVISRSSSGDLQVLGRNGASLTQELHAFLAELGDTSHSNVSNIATFMEQAESVRAGSPKGAHVIALESALAPDVSAPSWSELPREQRSLDVADMPDDIAAGRVGRDVFVEVGPGARSKDSSVVILTKAGVLMAATLEGNRRAVVMTLPDEVWEVWIIESGPPTIDLSKGRQIGTISPDEWSKDLAIVIDVDGAVSDGREITEADMRHLTQEGVATLLDEWSSPGNAGPEPGDPGRVPADG